MKPTYDWQGIFERKRSEQYPLIVDIIETVCRGLGEFDLLPTSELVDRVAPAKCTAPDLRKKLARRLDAMADRSLATCAVRRGENWIWRTCVAPTQSPIERKRQAMLQYMTKQAEFDLEAKAILEMSDV